MKSIADLQIHLRPLSTGAFAVYKTTPALVKQFTVASRYGEEFEMFAMGDDPGLILLPRECCPVGLRDGRTDGVPVSFPMMPTPRENQTSIFADTLAFLNEGKSGVVVAYTGWGKTVLGLYIAARLGIKTLVITTKDDVYLKWYADAKRFLGLPDHEVGEIRGNKCEVVGTKFCVGMIHSLSRHAKYEGVKQYFDEFGLIIFDEVQRLPAEHFQKVAFMFKAKLRLGLSARPNRADGRDIIIQAHIGPTRVKTTEELMVPEVFQVKTSWRCPRVYRQLKDGSQELVVFPHTAGKTIHVEKILADDSERNRLIAHWVHECYKKKRIIVVFSTIHDHLIALGRACIVAGVSKADIGFYIGATTKKEKEERNSHLMRQVVFTTFGMMGEGTDVDWIDTCFLAMPRANVLQPVGRIRRQHESKRPPIVFDFADYDSPVFAGYVNSREKWYASIKAKIEVIEE